MASQQQPTNGGDTSKRKPYPYTGFQRCDEIVRIVANHGGATHPIDKSLIAEALGLEENSGALIQSLGDCKTFGFLEGRGSYTLSERAKRYVFPESDVERDIARLELIKQPTGYSDFIDRFDGQKMPSAEVLVNILKRDGIGNDTWRPRIVSQFLTSLKDANVIDGSGFLRYKASLHRLNNGNVRGMSHSAVPSVEPAADRGQATPPPSAPAAEPSSSRADLNTENTTWFFKGRTGVVRVETPEQLTADMWKKLSDYVNVVLKPEEVQ